jgi:metal-sulfur cluster biosynthetic enzyme
MPVTEEQVYEALRDCYDPEIPVNVVDLGLIYEVKIIDDWVGVKMTLTAPGCPAHSFISQNIQNRLKKIPGIQKADVRIVWEPHWEPKMMSEEAKKKLNWQG